MAPILVASYFAKVAGVSPVVTPSFTPNPGEILVVKLATWDTGTPMGAPTATGLTFTPRVTYAPGGFKPWTGIYTAVVGSTPPAGIVVSSTPSANARFSMVVERWRDAALAGSPVTVTAIGSGSAPSASMTTSAGSIISWVSGDSNSVDPATRAYLLSGVDEGVRDDHVGSNGVDYHGYAAAAGAGSQTFGLSAPTGQGWAIAAIEILAGSATGESLFVDPVPNLPDNTDGTPGITFGTTVQFSTSGQITHVRFRTTNTAIGNYQGAVWQVNTSDPNSSGGTLLGTTAVINGATSLVSATDNVIPLSAAINVTPGVLYRVAVFSDAGRYVATGHLFDNPQVHGHITAERDNADPIGLGALAQGTFAINPALSYPYQSFNATSYFADVVFIAGAAAPSGSSPNGLAVPAALGTPSVSLSRSAAPTGLAVGVALGTPATAVLGASPTGLHISTALGTPATAYGLSTSPTGLAVAVHLGTPSSQEAVASGSGHPRLVTTSTGRRLTTSTRAERITD